MNRLHITLVAGARPNFMKIASIIHAIKRLHGLGKDIVYGLVHTGQHYDPKLSDVFFEDLDIPLPDINLEAGSGSHAQQTADIMIRFENYLLKNPTNWVIVVGDVNSTLACTIVAKKLDIPVAHVEAGIRSGDMSMPEEINRLVTDSIADLFFTTSEYANDHLRREGKQESQIYYVGNTMIDTLIRNEQKFVAPDVISDEKLIGTYYLMTLHRPSNVDNIIILKDLLTNIVEAIENKMLIFSLHPRTRKKLADGDITLPPNVVLCDPLRYLEFLYLVKNAKAIITDSGGIQEEATFLGIPCLTLRTNTERPETIFEGTNILVGNDIALMKDSIIQIEHGNWKKGGIPLLWDGKAGERIVEILYKLWKGEKY